VIYSHAHLSFQRAANAYEDARKTERSAQRFIRLVLRGWQVTTIDELPEAARKSLMQQVEWNRNRFDCNAESSKNWKLELWLLKDNLTLIYGIETGT